MDIGLEPDGSVRSLSTRDNVTATLPATKDTPARTIRSTALTAAGTAQGLNQMLFTEGVEYREAATKTQGARIARAKSLEARLDPGRGNAGEARFTGNFDFTDGPMRALSNDARYNVTAGTLALTGKEITPEIRDESLTLLAEAIDVTLDPRKMTAKGNVRSTLLPPKKPAGNAPATKRPALLGDKEPVNILSNTLTYDEANKKADYAGQTRLLQGATTINADKLTLDEAKGDLTATGKVVTNLVIANKQAEPGAKPKPTIGSRRDLHLFRRHAHGHLYDGRAVRWRSGQPQCRQIGAAARQRGERARQARSHRRRHRRLSTSAPSPARGLTYSPADDKYVVLGAPVKMIDADCQETNGKTLTFWKASDRVVVDGNNEVRTQTKGGGKCTATPPK